MVIKEERPSTEKSPVIALPEDERSELEKELARTAGPSDGDGESYDVWFGTRIGWVGTTGCGQYEKVLLMTVVAN